MNAVAIIPVRMESSRFPNKPLADIFGKPMIYYVWKQSKKCKLLDEVFIATDSKKIKFVAENFGAKVILTSRKHKSGTDRIAEAAKKINCNIIINVQGDEPLVSPSIISRAVKYLLKNKPVYFLTYAKELDKKEKATDSNINKVVFDKNGDALYFSRSQIPFLRQNNSKIYKHLGFYAYKKEFLLTYSKLKQTPLEKTECLEQLRALENGYKLRVLITKDDCIGVDTPKDLKVVKKLIKK